MLGNLRLPGISSSLPDISLRASAQREVESAMIDTEYPISLKYSAIVIPVYIDASLAKNWHVRCISYKNCSLH